MKILINYTMVLTLELGGIKKKLYICSMKNLIKQNSVFIAIAIWFALITIFAYIVTK
jgi:hypothetical protein